MAATVINSYRPVVMEISGLPGSGKSTIFESLSAEELRVERGFRIRPFRDAPKIVAGAIPMLPLWIASGFSGPFLERAKALLYLRTLFGAIQATHLPDSRNRLIVFDQGPVSLQAYCLAIGSAFRPSSYLTTWIYRNIGEWSTLLRGIVWLEADDASLIARVLPREKAHSLQIRTELDRHEFLCGFRKAFEQILVTYESYGTKVLRLSTVADTPAMSVHKVQKFIESIRNSMTAAERSGTRSTYEYRA